MLYYADNGPEWATKLLRVDAPGSGLSGEEWESAWRKAKAERWMPKTGWQPYPGAQSEIRWTGELFLVDEDEVPLIQQQIREQYARYRIA